MNRILTVALSAVLAVASVAGAQTTRPARPNAAAGEGAALFDRLQERLGELNLTDDQKQQVQALKDSIAETVRGMAGELKNSTPDERREKIREAVNAREKLMSILTPEQQAKLRGGLGGEGQRRPLAQQAPATQPQGRAGTAGAAGGPMIGRLKEAVLALGLSAEQKEKVDAVLAETAKEAQKLRQAAAGDRAAVREKVQALTQSTRDKIEAVLTPEQKQKFAESFRGRPGGGGGRVGPGRSPKKPDAQTKPSDTGAATAAPASSQPAVGKPAPAFTLQRLNGNDVTNKNFAGKPLVIAFGSLTSPSFRDRVPKLLDLKNKYRSRANVVVVYTREAHPSDGWQVERNRDDKIEIPRPKTDAERLTLAKQLRDRFGPELDVLVDDLNDTALIAFGNNPEGAAVIAPYGQLVGTQKFTDVSGLPRLIDEALKTR